ncbi:hypothetical protein [Nocardiopsis sp. LOL_012]|uniref:hypothetical protein n=1 Tax=Nocardiopsis sp. LOL_012 TaxID=3345409 RepID=UPI003A88E8B2
MTDSTPPVEEIHATSTPDMETVDMLHAAAERMAPIAVTTRHGQRVLFTPAPATLGVRFP